MSARGPKNPGVTPNVTPFGSATGGGGTEAPKGSPFDCGGPGSVAGISLTLTPSSCAFLVLAISSSSHGGFWKGGGGGGATGRAEAAAPLGLPKDLQSPVPLSRAREGSRERAEPR